MTKVRIRWRVEAEYEQEFDGPDFVAKLFDHARHEWAVQFIADNVADDDYHPVGFDRDVEHVEVLEIGDSE